MDFSDLLTHFPVKSDPKTEAARKKSRDAFEKFLKTGAYVEVKVGSDKYPCIGIRKVGDDYLELDIYCTSKMTGQRIDSKILIHKTALVLLCDERVKGNDAESCPKTYAKFLKILSEN